MFATEWPQPGDMARWDHDTNTVTGLVISRNDETGAVCILVDALTDTRAWVLGSECSTPTADANPYVMALNRAAQAVATVAATLAMAGEQQKCAGASRAYSAVTDLLRTAERDGPSQP